MKLTFIRLSKMKNEKLKVKTLWIITILLDLFGYKGRFLQLDHYIRSPFSLELNIRVSLFDECILVLYTEANGKRNPFRPRARVNQVFVLRSGLE